MTRPVHLLALIALAACGSPTNRSGDCDVDDDCGGDYVCARNGECLPPASVRAVRVTWTIRGQTASSYTCAESPSLYLLFLGFDPNDSYGYEPVPCNAGELFVDKIPTRFNSFEIGARGGFSMEKVFDSSGNVTFDLMP
jgi:hypothetical protein